VTSRPHGGTAAMPQSSRLAYLEVRAALAAAGRAHRLDPDAQRQAEVAWQRALTNGKADYWTYIQEAIWSMSSDDEDQQSYLKSSSLVSP